MTPTLKIFRPHRTPPEQLEQVFVAREPLLNEMLEKLAQWQPGKSRHHYLIIGPRGIGKTNLLRLLEHRIEKSPELRNKWLSISFSEDAYGITRITDLLVEGLRILSEKTRDKGALETYEQIRYNSDEKSVIDLSLDAFRKVHRQRGCGVIFLVENVNRVLEKQIKKKSEIHLLRKILIEEEWIGFTGTSPTYLDAVTKPEEPLFEFFHVERLEELTFDEQLEMLQKIARLEKYEEFIDKDLNRLKPQLKALYHFTGGNPRLSIMLYDLIANQNIREIKEELDALLDKLTPFYQDRMRDIGADQAAKLIERMALMHEGCTPTELARELRMTDKLVSALLTRLERGGYVRREPRRQKRTVYIIPERFFRIWHQMNHSLSDRGRIQFLLEFFASWYATPLERAQVWKELMDKLLALAHTTDKNRVDEIEEYIQYIEEIGIGGGLWGLQKARKERSELVKKTIEWTLELQEWFKMLAATNPDTNNTSPFLDLYRDSFKLVFEKCNLETIEETLAKATNERNFEKELLKPYTVALDYLKSDKNPAIIERQQPEMREAVQLLVNAFENKKL